MAARVISSRLKAGTDRPAAGAGLVQTESSRDPGGLRGTGIISFGSTHS
jgi:hypothetical protein